MDRRFLDIYNRELQYLRGMSSEFAREFPKIAGRLGGLSESEPCRDPFVERLLEGFAFLAARVQLKLEAEFPRFTQSLLETAYPHYLVPTPSMAMVQFQPDLNEGGLAEGFEIPRDTSIQSILGKGDQTRCEYRTAHDVTLWPLQIAEGQYHTRDLGVLELPETLSGQAGLRLRLQSTAGLSFQELKMDELTVYLKGAGPVVIQLYEQLFAQTVAVVVQPTSRPISWRQVIDAQQLRQVGFDDDQKLLPYDSRSFHGYRLLHEYFAFPQRFMFFQLAGLNQALKRCQEAQVDITFLFRNAQIELEGVVSRENFELFATPAINLFPRHADRIHLTERFSEYHVIADRTRPQDFEIYRVSRVVGYGGKSGQEEREFRPFYSAKDLGQDDDEGAYYAVHRVPRTISSREKQYGRRSSSYGGSEVYVSLVDVKAAPYRSDLRQLGVEVWCTNRDLALHMAVGQGRTDFTMEKSAPCLAINCIGIPSKPRPSHIEGEIAWRAVSHLALNYLSLTDGNETEGAAALRDLLKLYGDAGDPQISKQIEGIKSVSCRPMVRRLLGRGPVAFANGLEVTVTFDEVAFEGTGVFLLGSVLEHFFAKYVSINSFTETVVKTLQREEVMRWPTRIGQRQVL
ncbi:MAG: type VI secretion system protein ImpG [Phycisphaerae bacterium SM23_30]|nr:MAG: type VI secretion system protein ImpG [Phycisphaerae bacterium SM23_30]